MDKKKQRSLRNDKLNAKEGNNRSSETVDHKKQQLATLKRLKRCDENELNRKLRLEKVVTNIQLRVTMEMEEDKRARPENVAATKRLSLANSSGWLWREKKIEQQNWRMMDLPNGSGWPWRRTKKEKED